MRPLTHTPFPKRPPCPSCGKRTYYVRKDGSMFCRVCGYDGDLKIKKEEKC